MEYGQDGVTDMSVLELNISEAVESILVSISKHAQRINESKRSLSTKLVVESHRKYQLHYVKPSCD
jgi:hypothetical protein